MSLETIAKAISGVRDLISGRSIIVYGTGRYGEELGNILRLLSLDIKYYVSANSIDWGHSIVDVEIRYPHCLKDEKPNDNIVLVATPFYQEVAQYLQSIGLVEDVDFTNGIFSCANKFENFGFAVGKHTYGFEQFCYPLVRLNRIGAFCVIADNVTISLGDKPLTWISTHPFFMTEDSDCSVVQTARRKYAEKEIIKKVVIGNDVTIGTNVMLAPHVKIGNGAFVSSGSVVTKDIPDYAIVEGCPAEVVGYRFCEDDIKVLNRIQWWNWTDKEIFENVELFNCKEKFFGKFAQHVDKTMEGKKCVFY